MYCIGYRAKYIHSSNILIKLVISRQIFEKNSGIKLHENPFSGGDMSHAD